ncbi:MAG: hypothetical protein NXY57DRAFT_968660 [Lentinula lateritia]|nr:MAG: hypothetical protein NXY57DRAFT_968660 [Lentinula lateritia]
MVPVAPFELQPAPSMLQHKPSHTKPYLKTYSDPGLTAPQVLPSRGMCYFPPMYPRSVLVVGAASSTCFSKRTICRDLAPHTASIATLSTQSPSVPPPFPKPLVAPSVEVPPFFFNNVAARL